MIDGSYGSDLQQANVAEHKREGIAKQTRVPRRKKSKLDCAVAALRNEDIAVDDDSVSAQSRSHRLRSDSVEDENIDPTRPVLVNHAIDLDEQVLLASDPDSQANRVFNSRRFKQLRSVGTQQVHDDRSSE